MIFFTADTHFGGFNIIKHCNRPFKNVEEMDEAIIRNWNNRVSYKDTVYHLGDFLHRNVSNPKQYLDRLNGKLVLVAGNHDREIDAMIDLFALDFSRDILEIKYHNQLIIMCHYKMAIWRRKFKKKHPAWMLYGHSHGCAPDELNELSMDVGVDCNGFAPLSFNEIKKIMENKHAHTN